MSLLILSDFSYIIYGIPTYRLHRVALSFVKFYNYDYVLILLVKNIYFYCFSIAAIQISVIIFSLNKKFRRSMPGLLNFAKRFLSPSSKDVKNWHTDDMTHDYAIYCYLDNNFPPMYCQRGYTYHKWLVCREVPNHL